MSGLLRNVFFITFSGTALVLVVALQITPMDNEGISLTNTVFIVFIYGVCLFALLTLALRRILQTRLKDLEQQVSNSFLCDKLTLNTAIEDKQDEFSGLVSAINKLTLTLDSTFIAIKSSVVRLKPMSQELAQASMGLAQRNQL